MLLKEIRLLDVDIFKDNEKIFSGKIENAYSQYRKLWNKRNLLFRWKNANYT